MINFRKILVTLQLENRFLSTVFYFLIVAVLISFLLRIYMVYTEKKVQYNQVIENSTEIDTYELETEMGVHTDL